MKLRRFRFRLNMRMHDVRNALARFHRAIACAASSEQHAEFLHHDLRARLRRDQKRARWGIRDWGTRW